MTVTNWIVLFVFFFVLLVLGALVALGWTIKVVSEPVIEEDGRQQPIPVVLRV